MRVVNQDATNQHIEVQHAPKDQRFFSTVDGIVAELDYERSSERIRITHTGVPPAIGGRGVAGELMRVALEYARAEGLKVIPDCAYAATYFKRHPQYADLLAS